MSNKYRVSGEELLNQFSRNISEEALISIATLEEISKAIRKNRRDRDMTQKEFADFLEVSQAMVAK